MRLPIGFALVALLAFAVPAATQQTYNPTAAIGSSGVIGTTTNDNAAAGIVGEYVSVFAGGSSGTATFTATSPTVVTVTTWSSPAGNRNTLCTPSTGVITCVQPVCFTNSGGALPTGISACGTQQYYIDPASYSGTTFKIATTPDNAIAGTDVGASDTGSGTQTASNLAQLTSTVDLSVLALRLTAGDWSCWSTYRAFPGAGTTTSSLSSAIGTVQGSTSAVFLSLNGWAIDSAAQPANTGTALKVGPSRESLSATSTIYSSANATFAVSTLSEAGILACRRAR